LRAVKAPHISSKVYNPLPLFEQKAYFAPVKLPVVASVCRTDLGLPMRAEASKIQLGNITFTTKAIVKQK